MNDREVAAIRDVVQSLARRYQSAEDNAFLREAVLMAQELPRSLRTVLSEFKLSEPVDGLCVIAGWPVDDAALGPTPRHWHGLDISGRTLQHEMALMLLGSLLGDPMGWSTQQDGKLIHQVLPILGHEEEQLGTGSAVPLWWHNEDAFHPLRPDYVILLCLRNNDRVATTYSSLEHVKLEPWQIDRLSEPHYSIRPDYSHLPKNRGDLTRLAGSYQGIERMNAQPERIAVLSGDRSAPYLRVDPYFMEPAVDPDAQSALEALISGIESALVDLVLGPGEFCIFDNYRAVHGRRPFRARFDGCDRWLERVLITRDLRRLRADGSLSRDRIV
jgi:Fe(II)/alpha-ketoglutarate-dependent arginine beta-hydroxylase